MIQVAFFPFALAVILHVPAFFPVTFPFESTVATEELLVFHVTFEFFPETDADI